MNDSTWHEEYSARFGRKLADREVETWDAIIGQEVKRCTGEELKAAVRRLGEQKRKGEFRYAPSVEDLISAVIKGRWEAKQARDGSETVEGCAYCRRGWLSYPVAVKGDCRRLGAEACQAEGWLLYSEAAPCLCSQGQRALVSSYDKAKHEGMRRWAREVTSWLDSIPDDAPFDVLKYIPHYGDDKKHRVA